MRTIKSALRAAYCWGRDNGEGRSDKNFNDFLEKDSIVELLENSSFSSEVTLMNDPKLGDTYINFEKMNPEKQWQRIDSILHANGFKVVRQ